VAACCLHWRWSWWQEQERQNQQEEEKGEEQQQQLLLLLGLATIVQTVLGRSRQLKACS
jgi:hypothetical protein